LKPKLGNYVIGLDHLRALAALLVFFWHGIHQRGIDVAAVPNNWVASLFEEGWVGVTLFITITGFVFTVITHGKVIDYLGFLKNRVLRLFPLIFLVTLYSVYSQGTNQQSLITFFSLLGGGTVYGTWTLVVEFQFYISYPFLRDTLIREEPRKTVLNCLVFCFFFVVLRLAYFYAKGNAQEIAYWTIFGQADAFIAGILAGLAYIHFRANPLNWAPQIYIGILVVTTTAILGLDHWFNETGGFYLRPAYPSTSMIWVFWPTISAVLWAVVVGSYSLLTLQMTGRLMNAIAYLGAISYSTYMLHFITLPLCSKLFDTYIAVHFFDAKIWNESVILMLFHYPITIVMSAISFELIEKAFLKQRTPYLTDRATV
jgi:peptidoglycan/LPS O-acetylase OafA/YrhL